MIIYVRWAISFNNDVVVYYVAGLLKKWWPL